MNSPSIVDMAETAATKTSKHKRERVLDPLERCSEILFGVIMVLTFTVALRVARANKTEVHEMLIGALGCNLAWGLIDGIMYLMSCISERGHSIAILRRVHRTPQAEEANRIIAEALPPMLMSVLPEGALEGMQKKMREMPDLPARPKLTADDWRGAVGVFLLVFLSTFPVVLPFIVFRDIKRAAHVSDFIAIAMLFVVGQAYGRYAGHRPWRWGLSMVAIGAIMVSLTIPLGG
jgi:hypothetical protein